MTYGTCHICGGTLRHLMASGIMQCRACRTWWQWLDGRLYAKEVAGPAAPRWVEWPRPGRLSDEEREKRMPALAPADMVDALQDPIHRELLGFRPAKAIRTR